jgi:hypothetical protein
MPRKTNPKPVCEGCGTELLKPAPDGRCGFCTEAPEIATRDAA